MNIDMVGVKTVLTLTFDFLENTEFQYITGLFDIAAQHANYPNGVKLEYFDITNAGDAKKTINCYIDSVTYLPHIVDDEIKWRDVTFTFVEL